MESTSSAPTLIAASASAACDSVLDSSNTQFKRVLTVGDGNFSYSLAYAKRFVVTHATAPASSSSTPATATRHNDAVQLVATSYDSYDELVDKYPESARIVTQLRDANALVLHRIDATNLRASLAIASTAASSEPSASTDESERALAGTTNTSIKECDDIASTVATEPFDAIIFNHPHCGEENVRRHQSLLSHFYASALELLGVDGEVHLTLAAGQPERWQALERAQQAGLRLKQQIDDVDSDDAFGLAYDRKRHQNGKSFHRVLLHGEKLEQQSTLFILERASGVTAPSQLVSAGTGTHTNSVLDSDTSTRKRKAPEASEPRSQRKQQQTGAFACTDCDRSFKTAQGLKTHVHMVHELGQNSASTTAAPVLLPCGVCDRTFKNADAQRQHRIAKHGADPLIQPDWYQKQQAQDASSVISDTPALDTAAPTSVANSSSADAREQPQETTRTCSICHLAFRSQSALDSHWQDLRPKAVEWRNCSRCGRAFDEERALRQHQNFCIASSSKADGDARP